VPQMHVAGTPVICWQLLANASEARFAAGETVSVRMLPETGFGTLPLSQAPEDRVTLASRAIRPLPPGDLRGNGVSVVNPNLLNLGPVLLTWAHRDRLLQTSGVFDAYDAGDIGPEPGVSYVIEIRWIDPVTDVLIEPPAAVIEGGIANSYTLTKEDVPLLAAPSGTKHLDLRVQARRTTGTITYEARAARSIRLFMPDGIKVAEAALWIEYGAEARLTVPETVVFLGLGGAVQLTTAEAALWVGLGADARLSAVEAALFQERGGAAGLTAATTDLYIEVIP